MKFLHIADLHLGKQVADFSMLEDQRFILREILSMIDFRHPDAVVVPREKIQVARAGRRIQNLKRKPMFVSESPDPAEKNFTIDPVGPDNQLIQQAH